jgi:hypothetical protein
MNLLSIYLICVAAINGRRAISFWPIEGKHFMLDLDESSGLNSSNVYPMFASLICSWPKSFFHESIIGRKRILSFRNVVKITGWTYQDIVSQGNGSKNQLTLSSDESITPLKKVGLSLHSSFDARHWDKREPAWPQSFSALQPGPVDLRPPVWWIFHNIISPLALAISSFIASFYCARSSFRSGARLLSLGWLISSATHLISCLLGAPMFVARSCVLSATLAALTFIEHGILEGCLIVWSLDVALALYTSNLQSAPYSEHQTMYTTGGCVCVFAIISWRLQLRATLQDRVRRDRQAFEAAFARIRDDPALPRLAVACENIEAPLSCKTAATSLRQPTRSVSQLWDQAAALRIILDSRAQSWALSACGTVALASEGPSAVELFSLRDGDPALLFDYCAADVMFEDVGGLATCLELVQADPCVRILRVENGFGSAWSADLDGGSGYRCGRVCFSPQAHS